MPAYVRRELLTAAQRAELLALPTDRLEIRERYSLTPADFDLINRHRTEANRLGFAIQLCLLRYPGRAWLPAEQLGKKLQSNSYEHPPATSRMLDLLNQ